MRLSSLLRLYRKNSAPKTDDLAQHHEGRSFIKTALTWRGSVSPQIMPRVVFSGLYSAFVFWLASRFPNFNFSITPFEYSGAVLGLILVVRVNAGNSRWWEARKVWGTIVNKSRNLAIVGYQYCGHRRAVLEPFLQWLVIWPHTMREHLRGQCSVTIADRFFSTREVKQLRQAEHMPIYVGLQVASLLKEMRNHGLDDFSYQIAERERASLIDSIGACERIKTTPMPLVLAIKTRRFIFIFLLLLPFALVSQVGWLTPFIMCLTAYPLFCLDEIGVQLQDPFSTRNLSHLPLQTICQTIENNILAINDMPQGHRISATMTPPKDTKKSKSDKQSSLN